MLRRTPLRSNPKTTRAWQERSRSRQREKQQRRAPLPASKTPLRRTRIKPVSERRAKEQREYSQRRKEHFEKNPWCAHCATLSRQTPATDIHHLKGRDKRKGKESLYIAREFFIGLCRECHQFITDNPEWAKKHGWALSRHVNRDENDESQEIEVD